MMGLKAYSQSYDEFEYRHYKGSISTFPVSMDLFFSEDSIFGTYYYDRVGQRLDVSGKITNTNFVKLIENNLDGDITGNFELNLGLDNTISGTWLSADGSKSYVFSASENYLQSCRLNSYSIYYSEHLLDNLKMPETTYELFLWLPVTSPYRMSYNNLITNAKNDFFNLNCKNYDDCIAKINDDLIHSVPVDSAEIMSNPYIYAWDFFAGNSIFLNAKNYLVLGHTVYQYTGGAHGITSVNFNIYDLTTGNKVFYDDIFKSRTEDEVLDLILLKLQDDFRVDILYSSDEIFLTKNIGFNQYGVTFVYNQYDIAPYVAGTIRVTISYKELYNYLSIDFINRMEIDN